MAVRRHTQVRQMSNPHDTEPLCFDFWRLLSIGYKKCNTADAFLDNCLFTCLIKKARLLLADIYRL